MADNNFITTMAQHLYQAKQICLSGNNYYAYEALPLKKTLAVTVCVDGEKRLDEADFHGPLSMHIAAIDGFTNEVGEALEIEVNPEFSYDQCYQESERFCQLNKDLLKYRIMLINTGVLEHPDEDIKKYVGKISEAIHVPAEFIDISTSYAWADCDAFMYLERVHENHERRIDFYVHDRFEGVVDLINSIGTVDDEYSLFITE